MRAERQYLEFFETNERLIFEHSCDIMNALRREAYDVFKKRGFPTRKVEEYRYTNVEAAFAHNFGINARRIPFALDRKRAFRCSVPNMGTAVYFMVGDRFVPAIKKEEKVSGEAFIGSICDFDRQHPGMLADYYAKLCCCGDNGIADLNTMLAQDGLLIWIGKGCKPASVLQIVNLGCGSVDLMTNRRVLIVMDDGAEAQVLSCDHNMEKHKFLTTQVAEIYMGKDSRLNFCCIEETDENNVLFDNVYVRQKSGSVFNGGFFTLRNGLTRRTGYVRLDGKEAQTNWFGGIIGDDKEHIDTNLLVDHAVGGCKSNILFKYVLDGESVGAFAGKVLVRKDSQKTDSQETNANLCVSPKARMYTQPMLEIYADDVKCNHGSTIGRLDERALFYMAQRGIPPKEANMLLQEAFLSDAIRQIQIEPLRERLKFMVEECFRRRLKGCGGCELCVTK